MNRVHQEFKLNATLYVDDFRGFIDWNDHRFATLYALQE